MTAFEELPLDSKRNEFNNELLSLVLLIDYIRGEGSEEYFNYVEGSGMSEEEYLTKNYELIKQANYKLKDIFK